jgi:hypothetical protein
MSVTIVEGMCMLAIADADAVTLMAEKSVLIPALVWVLERESSKIWGINADGYDPIE